MSTDKSSLRIANRVAERRLAVAGEPGRALVIVVGKPRRDPDPSGDWVCSYLVEGLFDGRRRYAHGVDSLQALQMAIEGARVAIKESGLVCSYAGGEAGDIGIPRTIPAFGGVARDFAPRIERYPDRELKKLATSKGRQEVGFGGGEPEEAAVDHTSPVPRMTALSTRTTIPSEPAEPVDPLPAPRVRFPADLETDSAAPRSGS